MEVMMLLEALEDILDKANALPLSSKVIVNREELLEIIKDIRIKIPDEVKQAQWIKEERQKILFEAKKEAEGIRTECEDKLARIKEERQRVLAEAAKEAEIMRQEADKRLLSLIEESEIVKRANEQAREIIISAQQDAKKIRLGSRAYADDVLGDVEKYIDNISSTIKANRAELKTKKS